MTDRDVLAQGLTRTHSCFLGLVSLEIVECVSQKYGAEVLEPPVPTTRGGGILVMQRIRVRHLFTSVLTQTHTQTLPWVMSVALKRP